VVPCANVAALKKEKTALVIPNAIQVRARASSRTSWSPRPHHRTPHCTWILRSSSTTARNTPSAPLLDATALSGYDQRNAVAHLPPAPTAHPPWSGAL
jgi:hypothetical protein